MGKVEEQEEEDDDEAAKVDRPEEAEDEDEANVELRSMACSGLLRLRGGGGSCEEKVETKNTSLTILKKME